MEYCILIGKARQGKRSHSFCSRDDRMQHNISPLWKEEEKIFEPNFEIKDVKSLSMEMQDIWAEQSEVGEAAVRCFVEMYTSGKNDETLTSLW